MAKKLNVKPNEANYEYLAVAWHDSQRYSPAPRHRQRIMWNLIKPLDIRSVAEVGGGQPYLLSEIARLKSIRCVGTDVSKALIQSNKKEFPRLEFAVLDIVKNKLPEKFDLVIASEVLEHVSDYQSALKNMAAMANKYILITVPSSKVFPIDRMIGHYRHYRPEDMIQPLQRLGFKTKVWYKWGFPFHNLYKHAINGLNPAKMKEEFSEGEYGFGKKLIATILYGLFYLNLPFWGYQLIILAEKEERKASKSS